MKKFMVELSSGDIRDILKGDEKELIEGSVLEEMVDVLLDSPYRDDIEDYVWEDFDDGFLDRNNLYGMELVRVIDSSIAYSDFDSNDSYAKFDGDYITTCNDKESELENDKDYIVDIFIEYFMNALEELDYDDIKTSFEWGIRDLLQQYNLWNIEVVDNEDEM